MKKIYGLDYIRGICAVFIALYHYTVRYWDSYIGLAHEKSHTGLWWGCWAVAAFFIITGFLTINNMKPDTKASHFLLKRAIRLYPAYWFGIIFTTIFTILLDKTSFIGVIPTLINFTMLQEYLMTPCVDGVYWTLLYEVGFSLIIAGLIKLKLIKHIEKINTLWLFIIIIYKSFGKMVFTGRLYTFFNVLFLVNHAHEFIIGMSIALIIKNKKTFLSYFNIAIIFALIIPVSAKAVFVLISALLIFIFAKTNIKFKYDKPLVFLSAISYPLYLIHQKATYLVLYKLKINVFNFESMCIIITLLAINMIIAYCVHKYIELPLSGYLKRKLIKS